MKIDNRLLDELTAQAQASPRLRMNLDLRNSAEDTSQRMLNALEPGMQVEKGQWHRLESLESGTVIVEMKDGAYEPISPADIL